MSAPGWKSFTNPSNHGVLYHNAIIIDTSDNCCTSACGLREGNALGVKRRIAVVVGEVKARHRELRWARDQRNGINE
jgi:hypothetical protein